MIRALMAFAVLAMCSGAFAQEPTAGSSAPATTTAAPSAPSEAPAPKAKKKTRAECKKEGVKGKQAMKDCLAGK